MALDSLKALYVEQLKDLYSAETQITNALPKMIKKSSNAKLKKAFEDHLELTREHLDRLQKIFDDLGEKPTGHHCKGMEGLLKEGEEMMQEKSDPQALDAGLIAAAQRVEHYEMAGYGCVRTYAKALGRKDEQKTLQKTLDEEGKTDHDLTDLAEDVVNQKAMA